MDLPRTPSPGPSRFKASFDRALGELRRELKLLGASGVCVSTNLSLARDGWPDPRSRLRASDPGVAVYWMHGGRVFVLACDAWDRVEDNLHAIVLTIAADRGKTRWGCAAIEQKSMAGYAALPPPPKEKPWWDVFGCREDTPLDEVRAIYRARVKRIHPDFASNDTEKQLLSGELAQLNTAMEAAERSKNVA